MATDFDCKKSSGGKNFPKFKQKQDAIQKITLKYSLTQKYINTINYIFVDRD